VAHAAVWASGREAAGPAVLSILGDDRPAVEDDHYTDDRGRQNCVENHEECHFDPFSWLELAYGSSIGEG